MTVQLLDVLNEAVLVNQTPILGICLGMQLMTKHSAEGDVKGLGWIEAATKHFAFDNSELKIPHMGWNNLSIIKKDSLFKNISDEDFFYFVHSYYVNCKDSTDVSATTDYGHSFISSFEKENIFGCQFHPEKSHDTGLNLLNNLFLI